jgi:hypothetical protein
MKMCSSGSDAGLNNGTGPFNVAIGAKALQGTSGTSQSYNTAIGHSALLAPLSNADQNVAVGERSLRALTTGATNASIGSISGFNLTTGADNTFVGHFAGNNVTTGSNNVALGHDAAASSATVSNEITLGNASVTKLRVPGLSVDWAADDVPFRNIPQNSRSADYTLVLADSGKHILHPSADTTARTFTIPANGSVAFPVGTAVTFINQDSAGAITIAITTDTMRLAGAGTTGSRTLAANGVATAIKVTSTEWIISGTGLT